MSRPATVWWNKQRGAWCTDIGGARHVLAKGKANKKLAKDKLRELLDEQGLLAEPLAKTLTGGDTGSRAEIPRMPIESQSECCR